MEGFKVLDKRVSQMSEEELEQSNNCDRSESSQPTYIVQLEEQLAKAQDKLKTLQIELKEKLDYEVIETQKRLKKEAKLQVQRERANLATPMLEVLEALERSLGNGQSSSDALLEGIQLVHQLMLKKLEELGLKRITTIGERFDPNLHDAIGIMPVSDPSQDGMIVAEFSAGFLLDGKVMRSPKVQVGKAS